MISTRYDTMLDSWVSISPLSVSHPVRRVCLHWQLPAIGGYGTLLSAALDDEARAGGRRTARNLSSGQQRRTDTIARVRALFRGVCRFDLQQQHRCDDPAHAAATASMRSLTSHSPLTQAVLQSLNLRPLSTADIRADATWSNAHETTVLVGTNFARHRANRLRAVQFARATGEPVLAWRLPFDEPTQRAISAAGAESGDAGLGRDLMDRLGGMYEELTALFVRGAPAQMLFNLAPGRGLANGTRGTYHSVCLTPEQQGVVESAMQAASYVAGDIILLDEPPISINFELDASAVPPRLLDHMTAASLVVGKFVYPVSPLRSSTSNIKSSSDLSIRAYKYRDCSLDLAFAITVHKV